MAPSELADVEIEFWVDWYDGPMSGVARHAGQVYWFEAQPGSESKPRKRPLFLYPLSPDETARERSEHELWEREAKGRRVEEWPAALRERDYGSPSEYAMREPVGWFFAR
jgi:hypothetical protein